MKKGRSKSKKRTSGSKENNDYLTFTKRETTSPENNNWKARSIANKQTLSHHTTVKSTSKSKTKLVEAKSKKKVIYYK